MKNIIKELKNEFIKEKYNNQIEDKRLILKDLLSQDLIESQLQEEINQEWRSLEETMQRGMTCFLSQIKQKLSVEEQEKVQDEIKHLLETINSQGIEFSPPVMSGDLVFHLYEVARRCLEERNFQEAIDLFQLLNLLFPQAFEPWLGIGMAYQEQARFKDALSGYGQAMRLAPFHPLPVIYTAECYQMLQEFDHARHFIRQALDLFSSSTEFDGYKEEAQRVFSHL